MFIGYTLFNDFLVFFASDGVVFVNVILSPSHSTYTYSSTTRLEAVIL